jgi:hypothetical protein
MFSDEKTENVFPLRKAGIIRNDFKGKTPECYHILKMSHCLIIGNVMITTSMVGWFKSKVKFYHSSKTVYGNSYHRY